MNDSDIGYSYEWESEFKEWSKVHSKGFESGVDEPDFYPEIKKVYSENFILQNFFDEN